MKLMKQLIMSMELKEVIFNPRFIKKYLGIMLYVILSISLGLYLKDGLILFLGWNMILVGVVLCFTHVLTYLFHIKAKNIYKVILIILWILFYPNTYYVLTDLIHFQNYEFFLSYPDIYQYDLNTWLVFFHILIGSLYALKIGIDAIGEIRGILKLKNKSIEATYITLLFMASSVAIYLGRFIRLNSWDVLKIKDIFHEILQEFSFFIGFVFIYFAIHIITYLLFSSYHKKNI